MKIFSSLNTNAAFKKEDKVTFELPNGDVSPVGVVKDFSVSEGMDQGELVYTVKFPTDKKLDGKYSESLLTKQD